MGHAGDTETSPYGYRGTASDRASVISQDEMRHLIKDAGYPSGKIQSEIPALY